MAMMDEEQKKRIIEKVRKMLGYDTQRGMTSDAEIDNYLAKARRMMDDWNIKEAEVYNTPEKRETAKENVSQSDAYSRTSLVKFMVELAWVPVLICDVKFLIHNRRLPNGKKRQSIRFVGIDRDVAIAGELYNELLATMRLMCAARYGDSRPPEYNSYCLGFTLRLIGRAQELKDQACTAIVIANKQRVIDDWITQHYGELKNRTSKATTVIHSAYVNGMMDGEKVELNINGIR